MAIYENLRDLNFEYWRQYPEATTTSSGARW